MTRWGAVDYTGIAALRGPLLVVQGVQGVGWDEYVTVRVDDDVDRHGVVLEVDRDLAVVQVLEGTSGLDPAGTRVRFSGAPLRRCRSARTGSVASATAAAGRSTTGHRSRAPTPPPRPAHR